MLNDFSGDNSNNGACPLWISEEWCDLRGYALDDFWELFVLNWRRLAFRTFGHAPWPSSCRAQPLSNHQQSPWLGGGA